MSATPDRPSTGSIVAGFDGSDSARRAVRWAAREALSRDCRLLIVHAIEPPLPTATATWGNFEMFADERVRRYTEEQLTTLSADCRRDAPALTVDAALRDGHPVTALTDAVEETGAELLVLGSAGHGATARTLLGSTAAELVHSGRKPVVVVRGSGSSGPVVVGVDGSGMSDRAIGVAFDFAALHGCELHAIHAWSDRPADVLAAVGLAKPEPDRDVTEEIARTFVGAWADRYPQVVVRMTVVHDRPAHALLEHAEQANLLVVGNRGRGRIRSAVLGSVSHAVLYHAHCPVAVVPTPEDEQS